MIKRIVVTGLKARGYVDGRYVGEEKKEAGSAREDVLRGRKRRGKPAGAGPGLPRGKKRGAVGAGADNFGNTTATKRGRRGKTQGRKDGQAVVGAVTTGNGNAAGQPPRGPRGQPRPQARKNTAGKRTPFRKTAAAPALAPSPSQVGDMRRTGEEVISI